MNEDQAGSNLNSKKVVGFSNQFQITPEQKKLKQDQLITSSAKKKEREELSDKKKKALDLSNHNLIEKAKQKVNRAARNTFKPTKDSKGRNIKQHFGTWKYFVNKTQADEKEKYYITDDCFRVPL